MGKINVMKHNLVPEHRLIDREKEEEVLTDLEVERDRLPKMMKDDPVIKQMESIHGDIEEGRLIEITRESRTAGTAKAYRLVVKR